MKAEVGYDCLAIYLPTCYSVLKSRWKPCCDALNVFSEHIKYTAYKVFSADPRVCLQPKETWK